MKTSCISPSCLVCCVLGATLPLTSAAEILLNGATSTSQWAFRSFLDNTQAGSRAWVLNNSSGSASPIQTSGILSSVTPIMLTLDGTPDLSITGSIHAGLGGFSWTSDPDQAARDAFTNGSGFYTTSAMSINIPAAIATPGSLYHVEVLAFAGFAADRRFNLTGNSTPYATNWTVLATGDANYNDVLEFDIAANGTGITLDLTLGTDAGADPLPFIHAIGITPVPVPEPGSAAMLGGLALLAGTTRRRRR